MSANSTDASAAPLQFDAAVPAQSAAGADAAPCAQCGAPIEAMYYTVGGAVVCPTCRHSIESLRDRGTSAGRFSRALLFGLGGAIAGAILYFTVLAVTGLEIGLIAIAVGWLVGLGVSRGSRGRGGRRYQLLAVLLAYLAIDATYFGYLVKESIGAQTSTSADSTALRSDSGAAVAAANATAAADASAGAAVKDSGVAEASADTGAPGGILVLGFILGLPVIANVSNMPGGLIGLLIIFFALSQAWRMNAAVPLVFAGPFRVGARDADATLADA